jgi:hypothetical protein
MEPQENQNQPIGVFSPVVDSGKRIRIVLFAVVLVLAVVVLYGVYSFSTLVDELATNPNVSEPMDTNGELVDPNSVVPLAEGESQYAFISGFDSIEIPEPALTSPADNQDFLEQYNRYATVATLAQKEDGLASVSFGEYSITDLLDEQRFPATASLIVAIFSDLESIAYEADERFVYRAPATENPTLSVNARAEYLSYPPIRVLQAKALERILSELDGANAGAYLNASNAYLDRGIATGLYYRKDWLVAESVVTQYFEQVEGNAQYTNAFSSAREEWSR